MIIPHINWVPGGWHYWLSYTVARRAPRQIGQEWFCVVDDFGFLVPVRLIGREDMK